MKISIRLLITALSVSLILLATVIVTWVSISIMTQEVDDNLYHSGKEALEEVIQKEIFTYFEQAEQLAVKLSRNHNFVEMLKKQDAMPLRQWLELEIENTALIEVFNQNFELL
ncbi:MAG: hypothetical protein HQM14_01450 [SAR324 cluster bacterium]|nr:hypothetical protein [SAR324 cluster bacterium]